MTDIQYENLLKTNWVYEYQCFLVDKCEDYKLRLKLHELFNEFKKNSDFIV